MMILLTMILALQTKEKPTAKPLPNPPAVRVVKKLDASHIAMPPPPPTVEARTKDIILFDCRVYDEEFRSYNVTLRQTGGRGYIAISKSGHSRASSTWTKLAVEKDETGLLKGLTGRSLRSNEWPASILTDGKIPNRRKVALSGEETRTGNLSLRISDGFPLQKTDYVGFCKVSRTKQQPLTVEETEAYLKK